MANRPRAGSSRSKTSARLKAAPTPLIRLQPNLWSSILASARVDAVSTSAPPSEVSSPEPAAAAERARYGRVLGFGEFRVIFAANIASMLGSVVASVALTVLVYEQTRSPALAASVMALSFVPYLVGGVLFGAAADRLPP